MAPGKFGTIPASQGLTYWYSALTDGTATRLSGGRIPKMNPIQASAFLGSMTGEHGKLDWNNLDVVERGSGRGRGASQYTGVRRTPYDTAVNAARAAGKDPNSPQWQFEYFIREYQNKDLIGWTRVFEKMPQFKNVQEGVMYFTGSAQEGKGYFRPDKDSAHYDKRINYGQQILNLKDKLAPKTQAPAPNPGNKTGPSQFLDGVLQKLGIKGGPQSLNTDKLSQVLGQIAADPSVKQDVGLAIFASTKPDGFNASQSWRQLDNATKNAWRTVGGELGLQISNAATAPQKSRTYSLPSSSSSVGASQYMPSTKVDLSIGGLKPGDLGYGGSSSNAKVGGLPGLREIAQAGIANYGSFKNKSAGYGASAWGMSNATIGGINSRSYGSTMNLGGSLGINTAATAAAGAKYGGPAMSMNTSAINSAAWGGK
jgi:hypothetical protein